VPLGTSLTVAVDPAIQQVRITTRLGEDVETAEASVVGGRLTLPGAERIGIREVRRVGADGHDGELLGSTAVNLFSPNESNLAPGDPTRLVDMGRVPADAGTDGQPTRAEWWWPLALAALALLAVEWIVFHRPTRRGLARAFGRRPQPLGGRAP
jgi:hypothetical protein